MSRRRTSPKTRTSVGRVRLGQVYPSLWIRSYDDPEDLLGISAPFPETTDDVEHYRAVVRRGLDAAEALESTIHREIPGATVRVQARAGDLAGGSGPAPELLAFVLGDDPIGRIAALATLGALARRLLKWLSERSHQRLEIDDGVAILLAAHHLAGQTGELDLTLDGVEPLAHGRGFDRRVNGFVVTFTQFVNGCAIRHRVDVSIHGEIRRAWKRSTVQSDDTQS